MGEHLCLQWADFRENVDSAFGRLRYDKVFADVTLACEDGQQMDAHKVILAASSPIFEEILQRNKHPHPMIYMRGFQSKHFASTRPKPAYGRQGLDWIVGPGYSLIKKRDVTHGGAPTDLLD